MPLLVTKYNIITLPPLVRDGGIDLPQYLQQKNDPNWVTVLYEASVLLEDSVFVRFEQLHIYDVTSEL